METNHIKYKYALSEFGAVLCIDSITKNDKKDYTCIGCGKPLIPVLGEIRRWHFRHKYIQNCNFESYIHRLAKKLFLERYNKCLSNNLPFYIEYEVPVMCHYCKHGPCEKSKELKTYDLTRQFITISEEKKDGSLVPDLQLQTAHTSKVIKLYIEIAVTHQSTTQKINSGIRIIEFSIENEQDLEILNFDPISVTHDQIKFYNFNPKPINQNLKDSCPYHITYFSVFPNGKCRIGSVPIFEFENLKNNQSNYITQIQKASSSVFVEETERAFWNGIRVKNCFLCRYHAINTNIKKGKQKPVFCKYFKTSKSSNFAANCEIYLPDKKVFKFTPKS